MPFGLEDIVNDPDLGDEFVIHRITGHFGAGGWIASPPQVIPAIGVVTVASDKDLSQVPEGDRVRGAMAFLCTQPIYLSSESGKNISDELLWSGELYRVASVAPWTSFGFCKAIAVRKEGA
jgi:hypothetical protein